MIARVAARHAQLWQDQWPEWRYRHLLPRAAATRAAGRRYAYMVAAIELRDALRRRRAVARIERWQHVSRLAALRLFHACLLSEAREEADTVFFMRHPPELRQWFPDAAAVARPDGPTLFATLHLGSPVFAYLFLRSVAALDVRAIGRKLDERNPMPGAKRRYGLAKEAWLRGAAGVDLLEPSPRAMTDAREHLLAGRPLFAALDVPGDVVSAQRARSPSPARTSRLRRCGAHRAAVAREDRTGRRDRRAVAICSCTSDERSTRRRPTPHVPCSARSSASCTAFRVSGGSGRTFGARRRERAAAGDAHGAPLLLADDVPSTLPALLAARARASRPRHRLPRSWRRRERVLLFRVARGRDPGCRRPERAGLGPGTHALLVLDDERDLLTAFWGCLLACVAGYRYRSHVRSRTPRRRRASSPAGSGSAALPSSPPIARPVGDRVGAGAWRAAFALTDLQRCEPSVIAQPAADDVALLLLTSGSTGAAKLVEHSHRTIIAQCAATVQANGFTRDDVSLNWFPLDHVGGLVMFHLRDVFHRPPAGSSADTSSRTATLARPDRSPPRDRHLGTQLRLRAGRRRRARGARAARDLSCLRLMLNGGEAVVRASRALHRACSRRTGCLRRRCGRPGGCRRPARGSPTRPLSPTTRATASPSSGRPLPARGCASSTRSGSCSARATPAGLQVAGHPEIDAGYHGDPKPRPRCSPPTAGSGPATWLSSQQTGG